VLVASVSDDILEEDIDDDVARSLFLLGESSQIFGKYVSLGIAEGVEAFLGGDSTAAFHERSGGEVGCDRSIRRSCNERGDFGLFSRTNDLEGGEGKWRGVGGRDNRRVYGAGGNSSIFGVGNVVHLTGEPDGSDDIC